MTDNLPAVVEPSREIATADVDSWIPVASDVVKLANLIAPTEFVPRSLRDSAPATAAAILYGREVGLPPMTALTQTHVIEGKPAMSAEAMRALVLAAGHDIEVVDSSRARCELRGRRYGREKWTSVVVSIDEFGHLRNKDNWRNYPRQMLQARATAELARLVFPDVIHGFRAVEEFDDIDATEEAPAATPSTRVARKRTPAKKAAAATPPPLDQGRPETPSGPPLPGEDGYETSPGSVPPADDEAAVEGSVPLPGEAPEPAPSGGSAVHEPADSGATEEPPAGEDVGEASEPAGDSEGREPEGRPEWVQGKEERAERPQRGPRKASRPQLRMIFARLKELTGDDVTDEDRHDIATAIVGHRIDSFEQLTNENAKTILDTLSRMDSREELDSILWVAAAAGGQS